MSELAGADQVYVDGGKVIQTFLRADLIDEITIGWAPTLIGEGLPLFGFLEATSTSPRSRATRALAGWSMPPIAFTGGVALSNSREQKQGLGSARVPSSKPRHDSWMPVSRLYPGSKPVSSRSRVRSR